MICSATWARSKSKIVFADLSTRSDSYTHTYPRPPALVVGFHLPDWRYGAISLDAQVGVRIDPPTLEAI